MLCFPLLSDRIEVYKSNKNGQEIKKILTTTITTSQTTPKYQLYNSNIALTKHCLFNDNIKSASKTV